MIGQSNYFGFGCMTLIEKRYNRQILLPIAVAPWRDFSVSFCRLKMIITVVFASSAIIITTKINQGFQRILKQ